MASELVKRLVGLGLSEYESKCYVALLRDHPARPYQVSKKAGIPTSKIYEVVGRLQARGLVVPLRGGEEGYVPKDPERVIEEWRQDYLAGLADLEAQLKKLMIGRPTYMIWNTLQNEDVLSQGRKWLSGAEESVFLSGLPYLFERWSEELQNAEARGVSMHLLSYGPLKSHFGDLDVRLLKPPALKRARGTVLAVDHAYVLFVSSRAPDSPLQASWTDNAGVALMAEEYVQDKLFIEQIVENRWLQLVDVE